MQNIGPDIKELILTYETFVIPGFGAFETYYRPAEIKKSKSLLLPPVKEIRFHENLKSDDKILSGHIQKRYKLNQNKAGEIIQSFVKGLNEALDSIGNVEIEGFGIFRRDLNGTIHFEASPGLIIPDRSFGLPAIEITEPPKPVHEVALEKKITLPGQLPHGAVRKKKNLWIPAALIVLLAGIIVSLYYTGLLHSGIEKVSQVFSSPGNTISNKSSKIIFGQRIDSNKDTLKVLVNKELNNLTDKEKALMYKQPGKESPDKDAAITHPSQIQYGNNSASPYHIIAGAYLIPNNAERQKSKLEEKGLAPMLLPPVNDFYMVSLGCYSTAEEAQMAMDKLHRQYNLPLWILKI